MSRRFNSRHARVQADPSAKPQPPIELTDDNSFVDPTQSDRRIPNVLNARYVARAESVTSRDPRKPVTAARTDPAVEKQKKADAAAAKLLAARQAQADAEAELADLGL